MKKNAYKAYKQSLATFLAEKIGEIKQHNNKVKHNIHLFCCATK